MSSKYSRRQFIKGALAGSAVIGAQLRSPLALHAQPAGFSALICIQQLGGCDNFLFAIPTDTPRRNALTFRRGAEHTAYYADPNLVDLGYGSNIALHPNLKPLEPYLQSIRLTLGVANAKHVNTSGSHEIQQIRMALGTNVSATMKSGWRARLYDTSNIVLMGFDGARSQDFACSSQKCHDVPPLVTNTFGTYKLDGALLNAETQGGATNTKHVTDVLEHLANVPSSSEGDAAVGKFRTAQKGMLQATSDVLYTLQNFITPQHADYAALFPVNSQGYITAIRFRDVAQLLLRMKTEGSSERLVCVIPHNGYDSHAAFTAKTTALMDQLGKVLRVFLDDLTAMGILDNVVIHSETEFGRQIGANGINADSGTDHGVGFHTLTIGGKINGGSNGVWGEMISPALIASEYGYPRLVDSRALISQIIEQHLGINPMTTAFPAPISGEFENVPLSLFA